MSGAGQIQAQIDAAVQAALAPVLRGMAELMNRVAELEKGARSATVKRDAPTRPRTTETKTQGSR